MIKYKLQWKNYSCAFDTWEEAAQDAIALKVGRWVNSHEFVLDWPATIKAIHDE